MKHTKPKKSLADFSKTAIVPMDQLLKINGGASNSIIIEVPID